MKFLYLLTAALIASMVLPSCEEEAPPPPPPPPVETMVLAAGDVPVYSEWVGQTRGSVNTEIRARVEGFLEKVLFEEGRFIQKGAMMYRIDPLQYEAYLNKAKGELAEAEANLARATQDVVRYKPLVEQNAISREEYETSVQMERAAKASVEAARAAVTKAQLDLGYCNIVAPISGLAGKTELQVGNLVGRDGSTLLTTISKIDPIRVRFSLSERDLLDFRRRAAERQEEDARRVDLYLALADGTQYKYPGKLVLADNRVDARTGTLLLEAEFPNPEKLLQPGQFARVRSVTEMRKNVVVIPQRAISELQGQARVVIVDADNKVGFRNVDLGPRVGSGYVVNSGLEVGETIVIEGLQRLREGIVVNPTQKQVDIDSLVNRN